MNDQDGEEPRQDDLCPESSTSAPKVCKLPSNTYLKDQFHNSCFKYSCCLTSPPVRILIVEDEMIISEDLTEILENLGYQVAGTAISAREALQLLDEENPDLVLVDIRLKGGRDGIELARDIREHFRLPFIFLTSHADPATLRRAREVNPYGYLLKPFEEPAIHAAVEMALANFAKENNGVEQENDNMEMVLKDSLFVRSNGLLVKIHFTEILYLEADGNYTNVYTGQKRFALRSILKVLEEKLPPHRFARIHKSFLVNLAQITAIDSQSVHIGDKEIPISRSQHSWLLNQIHTL